MKTNQRIFLDQFEQELAASVAREQRFFEIFKTVSNNNENNFKNLKG